MQVSAIAPNYNRLVSATYGTGRLSVPLAANLYLGFEHVRGVPAQDGNGVSAIGLRTIDSLIARLSRLSGIAVPEPSGVEEDSYSAAVAQLSDLVSRIDASPIPRSAGLGLSETGLILNAAA